MRRYFLFCFMFLGIWFSATAQDKNDYVQNIMTKRILSCDDIGYNVALLVPDLYYAKKTDTLDAVIKHWERNCGMTEPATSLSIIYAIQQNTFNSQLNKGTFCHNFTDAAIADTAYFRKSIMANLHDYKYVFDSRPASDSNMDDVTLAYVHYYDLIYNIAASMINATDLSPMEKILVQYYCNPDTTNLRRLSSSLYNGSPMQHAYTGLTTSLQTLNGVDYALLIGAWIPHGNLSILGTSPYLGFLIGGRKNKWTIDFNTTIAFPLGNTPTYMVSNHDSLSPSNTFVAFYLGIDVNYALFHKGKSELDLLGTVAYQGIQVLNGSGNSAVLSLSSADPNAGICYKFYMKHRVQNSSNSNYYKISNTYIGLQAKYHFLFYSNEPGTNLSGNAFSIGILYGGTTSKYISYNK